MLDRSERLSAIEAIAGDAYVWIEARIKALEARDMDEERKAYWVQRWRKRQQDMVQIGGRAYADRKA